MTFSPGTGQDAILFTLPVTVSVLTLIPCLITAIVVLGFILEHTDWWMVHLPGRWAALLLAEVTVALTFTLWVLALWIVARWASTR